MRGFDLYQLPKLVLVMELLADKWVPDALLSRDDMHIRDGPKRFFTTPKLSAPRAYYMALASLDKTYNVFGDALKIAHKMSESYYLALLRIQNVDQALLFMVAADAKGVTNIKDTEWKMLGGIVDPPANEPTLDLIPICDAPEGMIPTASSVVYDEQSRKTAMEVLVSASLEGPEPIYSETFGYDYFIGHPPDEEDTIQIKIYFDNCTDTHGWRRAWAKCNNKRHPTCFRYCYTRDFDTMCALLIYLTAWTVHGMKPGMEKYGAEGHKDSPIPIEIQEAGMTYKSKRENYHSTPLWVYVLFS